MGRIVAQSAAAIILLCLLAVSSCHPKHDAPESIDSTQSEVQENDSASGQSENQLHARMDYCVPMEADYLTYINDPMKASQWQLLYSNRDPENSMSCDLGYNVTPNELLGSGGQWRNETAEAFDLVEFSSPQPFLDLVEYLDDHSDFFFNHSEFEGLEPGECAFPDGFIEGFALCVSAGYDIDERPVYYRILKAVTPGEEVPEELRYVLDTIRTEFAEQIAGRPIPRPEGTVAQDSE